MQGESQWQELKENEVDCYGIYLNLPKSEKRFTVLRWVAAPDGAVKHDACVIEADTLMAARKGIADTVPRKLYHLEKSDDDVPNLIEVWG